MSDEKIKIILADDHRLFREGIIELLKESSVIEVIGEVSGGKDLIEMYFEKLPDVMLLDISMPDMNGCDAFLEIRKRDKNAKALFLTMHTEEIYYYTIYKAGGNGLLTKNVFLGELETALNWIVKGCTYFGPDYPEEKLQALVKRFDRVENGGDKSQIVLSQRELEIVKLIVKGQTSGEIAEALVLSKRTVEKHREIIMKKANVKNLMELLLFAEKYF